MRIILILCLTYLLIWGSAKSQDTLDLRLTNEICGCLQRPDEVVPKELNKLGYCMQKAFEANEKLIVAETGRSENDTSYEVGYAFGQALAERISPMLINRCDTFFVMTLQAMKTDLPVSGLDSARSQLTSVNALLAKGDSSEVNQYYQALLLDKLGYYEQSENGWNRLFSTTKNSVYLFYGLAVKRRRQMR